MRFVVEHDIDPIPTGLASQLEELGSHPLFIPRLWKGLYNDATVISLRLLSNGAVVTLGLGLVIRERRYLLRARTRLIVPFAPLTNGGREASSMFLSELLAYARAQRHVVVEIDWKYAYDNTADILEGLAKDITRGLEFLIDLRRSEEALLGNYYPGKKKFKETEKHGLRTEIGQQWEDLCELRDLQEASSDRAREKDNIFSIASKEYYRMVYNACIVPGYSKIIFAKRGENRVSGLMFLVHNNRALVQRGGTTEEGFSIGASRYLHYALLRHLKELGCRDVFFGGVPGEAATPGHPQHGLYLFKKGFTARLVPTCRVKIRL